MGLSIGQIPSTLVAARRQPPAVEPAAVQGDRARFNLTQPNSQTAKDPGQTGSSATETPGAGFGPGTVSGPAAALVALGRSVRAAREAIPTLDEIRAQFQTGRAERVDDLDARREDLRTRLAERTGTLSGEVSGADRLAFNQFTEAQSFSRLEDSEPVHLASARPPEAPDFASSAQLDSTGDEAREPGGAEAGLVPQEVQRQRLNVTV